MVWGAIKGLEAPLLWMKVVLLWYGIVYCLAASAMDRWMWRGICGIDVAHMPVAEVCRLVYFYRKRHLQFVAVLFVGAFVWMVSDSVYTIYGVVAGGVAGVLLGTRELLAFMREYREVIS
ncbi:MAG: hypothetical protein K1V75_02325 [Muribaculaceae bacterium]